MVVTRSRSRSSSSSSGHGVTGGGAGVKILTPSLRTASMRSYKIYTGGNRSKSRNHHYPYEESVESHIVEEDVVMGEEDMEAAAAAAAETLTDMRTTNNHACMNPMHPITRYMYRMQVFNSSRTQHYKTAFIGYNNKNRLYYIHTVISNCYPESDPQSADTTGASATLPLPVNTLQTKYSSYINDSIENFVMTMIVPSREYDYYIQDDIIGVATTDAEFCDAVFGQDSSYYDVEKLMHDESSNETINGFKAFSLIPSRSYWFDPLVVETHSSTYSSYTIHSVLNILSQSQ